MEQQRNQGVSREHLISILEGNLPKPGPNPHALAVPLTAGPLSMPRPSRSHEQADLTDWGDTTHVQSTTQAERAMSLEEIGQAVHQRSRNENGRVPEVPVANEIAGERADVDKSDRAPETFATTKLPSRRHPVKRLKADAPRIEAAIVGLDSIKAERLASLSQSDRFFRRAGKLAVMGIFATAAVVGGEHVLHRSGNELQFEAIACDPSKPVAQYTTRYEANVTWPITLKGVAATDKPITYARLDKAYDAPLSGTTKIIACLTDKSALKLSKQQTPDAVSYDLDRSKIDRDVDATGVTVTLYAGKLADRDTAVYTSLLQIPSAAGIPNFAAAVTAGTFGSQPQTTVASQIHAEVNANTAAVVQQERAVITTEANAANVLALEDQAIAATLQSQLQARTKGKIVAVNLVGEAMVAMPSAPSSSTPSSTSGTPPPYSINLATPLTNVFTLKPNGQ